MPCPGSWLSLLKSSRSSSLQEMEALMPQLTKKSRDWVSALSCYFQETCLSLSSSTTTDLNIKNVPEVVSWCKTNKPSLVVVGPEDPLNLGVSDAIYSQAGISCFGPKQAAAQIECDKNFSKKFMDRHGIPTARFESFTSSSDGISFIKKSDFSGFVVKASGLAAGKGVIVTESREEAIKEVKSVLDDKVFGAAGSHCIVEEKLEGYEVSVLAFCDGSSYSIMPPAQDHKRAFDGDEGPNTGGMGAFCPVHLESPLMKQIETEIISRAVNGLKKENTPFVGVLYAGVMVTDKGPKVLEYNCRFGDPETQVILPLLDTDIYEVFQSCVTGTLNQQKISWKKNSYATGVVVASEGYPGTVKTGRVITGLNSANLITFHGGTKRQDSQTVVSSGGRVLTVVAVDSSLHLSAKKATAGAALVHLEGSFFRKDIAKKELVRCAICQHGSQSPEDGLTYKSAGVDIIAGEELVDKIKVFAGSTHRKGVMESLGGFGALFDLKASGFIDPILVSGTDGVGTKLRVALQSKHFNSVGIDLVAMCVNDILVQGAEPLFFLDYFACGQLEVDLAAEVIEGIAKGCRDSGCALVGGETAEMPGMYSEDDFDLAGFCVGAVDRGHLLPRTQDMRAGDVIIGLPSSGVHSNGFSLVRKLVSTLGLRYEDPCPFDSKTTLGQALLVPTELYVKPLLSVVRTRLVKGLAHITGGGLTQNIPRILPKNLTADLDASKWRIPPVFEWIMREGHVKEEDMLVTFNCGVGMTVIVDPKDAEFVLKQIHANGVTGATVIGKLVERTSEGVIVRNFSPSQSLVQQKKESLKKKVAVLISGSGTNLQALIDSTTGVHESSSSAEIALVISNIEGVQGLERAKKAGIKTVVVTHTGKKRVDFDMEVDAVLRQHSIEYVFLAGFMRIISPEFVRKWEGRLVNIHPSLLPSFKGMHTHEDALAAGVKVHGCTVHFVDDGVDTGAIILQETTQVLPEDTPSILQERVKTQCEHRVYPLALQLITSGRLVYDKNSRKAVWTK